MINATSTMQLVSAGIRLDREITEGVVVVEVERDSPADKAGFLKEDVLLMCSDGLTNMVTEQEIYEYVKKK